MDLSFLFSTKEYEIIDLDKKYSERKLDFLKMFDIQEKVLNSDKNNIRINATECEYISPTCLAILSSIILFGKSKIKDIKITFEKSSKLLLGLRENGFINIDYKNIGSKNNIPLNIIKSEEDITNIIDKLISLSPLKDLNQDIKNTLYSRLYEIPNNALTHSKSEYGAICHGYYTNKKSFTFSIYDVGIGIPASVREYNGNDIDSIEALKWALERGNTTKATDYPRGIGFSLLEEFRKELKGKITIITEDVLYTIRENNEFRFTKLKQKVKGTLFTLKISV